MSNLTSIVYVSSAVHLFSEAELINLLEVSRRNNADVSITGMLLYAGGNFLQLIEGPQTAVNRLYAKISADPLHHCITQLGEQSIHKRQFPHWSMGYRSINSLSEKEREGLNPIMDKGLTLENLRDNPIWAYILLTSFQQYL